MLPEEITLPAAVASAEMISRRRGSNIWRVVLDDGCIVALKYATDNHEDHGVRENARLLAAREAAVLAVLDPNVLYASGETEAGTWLAVTWSDAPALAHHWRRARSGEPLARADALAATRLAADAIANLHERGWRHGDLQADHILAATAGFVRLLDLALAQGPVDLAPHIPYRGALAHLTAPEIAAEILATPPEHHVELTPKAEVYTFGGLLFAAWTGQWPHDYRSTDTARLTVAQIHAAICQPATLRPIPEGWPSLAAALAAMLDARPANRPTMAETARLLNGVQP